MKKTHYNVEIPSESDFLKKDTLQISDLKQISILWLIFLLTLVEVSNGEVFWLKRLSVHLSGLELEPRV